MNQEQSFVHKENIPVTHYLTETHSQHCITLFFDERREYSATRHDKT